MTTHRWHTKSKHPPRYGKAWKRTRERILDRDQHLCQCQHCKKAGRPTVATEVDHIISWAKGEALGWDVARISADDNLQAINHDCHERKTQEEQGKVKHVRLRIGLDGYPAAPTPGGT